MEGSVTLGKEEVTIHRRDLLTDVLLPIAVVAIIGIASSLITAKVTIATTEQKFGFIDEQLSAMKGVVEVLQTIQIELSARGVWMERITSDIDNLKDRTDARYTSEDARRDFELVNFRIAHLEKISSNGPDIERKE